MHTEKEERKGESIKTKEEKKSWICEIPKPSLIRTHNKEFCFTSPAHEHKGLKWVWAREQKTFIKQN